jgi:hypothetical protein
VSPPRTRRGQPDGCTAVLEGGPSEADSVQRRGVGGSKRDTDGKSAFVPSETKQRDACLTPCAA